MTTKHNHGRLTPSPAFKHSPKGRDPLMFIFKAATTLVVAAIIVLVTAISYQMFGAVPAGLVAGIWATALVWLSHEEAGKQV